MQQGSAYAIPAHTRAQNCGHASTHAVHSARLTSSSAVPQVVTVGSNTSVHTGKGRRQGRCRAAGRSCASPGDPHATHRTARASLQAAQGRKKGMHVSLWAAAPASTPRRGGVRAGVGPKAARAPAGWLPHNAARECLCNPSAHTRPELRACQHPCRAQRTAHFKQRSAASSHCGQQHQRAHGEGAASGQV